MLFPKIDAARRIQRALANRGYAAVFSCRTTTFHQLETSSRNIKTWYIITITRKFEVLSPPFGRAAEQYGGKHF